MTEEEIQERIVAAKMAKEELAAEKLKLEIQQIRSNLNVPFYRSTEFLSPLIAGISLSLILAAYIQYVFLPTQTKLTQKAETAEFTIQQNSARYGAQLAKLDLKKEQIEREAKISELQLDEANKKLKEARKQNLQLQERLKVLITKDNSDVELVELQDKVEKSEKAIGQQLAQVQDVELSIDGIKYVDVAYETNTGWIYIGYYPDEEWDYRTIDIPEGIPIIGQEYVITKNINIRNHAPRLSWFKYKFGAVVGYLVPNQSVRVIDTKIVGNSKVWAEIETVNNDA